MTKHMGLLVGLLAGMVQGCGGEKEKVQPDNGTPADAAAVRSKCDIERPGPLMVEIPAPDGTTYCMDTTEVTLGQYGEFLIEAAPLLAKQDIMYCREWNITFKIGAPNGCGPGGDGFVPPPINYLDMGKFPDKPVVCVDWCDARAYCQWAGKRLCGKIGGGKSIGEGVNDPAVSEWYNACTSGNADNTRAWGTGTKPECPEASQDGYDPELFNHTNVQDISAECNASEPPFNSLVGLSSNVGEWTDEVNLKEPKDFDGATLVSLRGWPAEGVGCAVSWTPGPTDMYPDSGFRCCAD